MKRMVLLTACGLLASGCGSSWKDFAPEGGRFRVQLPAAPVEIRQPGGLGITYRVEPKPGVSFVVLYLDLTGEAAKLAAADQVNQTLDAALAKLESNLGGKIDHGQRIKLDDYPGREAQITTPERVVHRVRMYQVGPRYYQVVASGPAAEVTSEGANRFLNSFRLTTP